MNNEEREYCKCEHFAYIEVVHIKIIFKSIKVKYIFKVTTPGLGHMLDIIKKDHRVICLTSMITHKEELFPDRDLTDE